MTESTHFPRPFSDVLPLAQIGQTPSDQSVLIRIRPTLSVESTRRIKPAISSRIFDKSRIEPVACSFSKRPQLTESQRQNWALKHPEGHTQPSYGKKRQTRSAEFNQPSDVGALLAKTVHSLAPKKPTPHPPIILNYPFSIINLSLSILNFQFFAPAELHLNKMGFVCN